MGNKAYGIGANRLLGLAAEKRLRFLLAASVEIYGENPGDVERFHEMDCGYLDCNTLQAGDPGAKRCSEALRQVYIRQRDVDAVIVRTCGGSLGRRCR